MMPFAMIIKKGWLQNVSTHRLAILGMALVFLHLRKTNILLVPSSVAIFESIDSALSDGLISGLLDPTTTTHDDGQHVLDNQTYVWYANQWVPPRGIPVYTREDMKAVFSQFDTLWIGDSTGRRSFGTMYGLMTSTSTSVSQQELSSSKVINVNKFAHVGRIDEDSCKQQREEASKRLEPGLTNMWTSSSVCRRLGQRSFDFIRAGCFKDLSEISRLKEEMKRYTLVIVAIGIHEVIKSGVCALDAETMDSSFVANMTRKGPHQDLERNFYTGWEAALQIANTIEQAKGHHNATTTAVLFRTSGFDSGQPQRATAKVLHLNQLILDRFQNKTVLLSPNGTIALVDWGKAVFPRSFDPERIGGDITAHYGLEPRMLMGQMTTQQVMNVLDQTKGPSLH